VTRILVSSWPGGGTAKLYNFAPKRVVAGLTFYKQDSIMQPLDRFRWMNAPEDVPLILERLGKKDIAYKTIGEFHAELDQKPTQTMIEIAKIARDNKLVLHAHAHHGTIEKWLKEVPDVKILWAHAGFVCKDPCPQGAERGSPPASVVQALLDRHPDNLYTELSYRDSSGDSITEKNGKLPKVWKEIIRSHPKNVMLGSDTYVRDRWVNLVAIEDNMRGWLMDPEIAEFADDVAHGNAERLFGL
jgi:predicted TIM-barrel fold metal-dependent hydrolase